MFFVLLGFWGFKLCSAYFENAFTGKFKVEVDGLRIFKTELKGEAFGITTFDESYHGRIAKDTKIETFFKNSKGCVHPFCTTYTFSEGNVELLLRHNTFSRKGFGTIDYSVYWVH